MSIATAPPVVGAAAAPPRRCWPNREEGPVSSSRAGATAPSGLASARGSRSASRTQSQSARSSPHRRRYAATSDPESGGRRRFRRGRAVHANSIAPLAPSSGGINVTRLSALCTGAPDGRRGRPGSGRVLEEPPPPALLPREMPSTIFRSFPLPRQKVNVRMKTRTGKLEHHPQRRRHRTWLASQREAQELVHP